MAKRNWISEIMGGQILLHSGILQQARFVLYIFVLIILYISINFGIEKSMLTERRNQKELKNLKADYTSKSSKLMYQSKRAEVEKRLFEQNSKLIIPTEPPRRILIEK
ncbi:MAG: FtsL-like putative cell division protein [Bacteroidales bacterium]